VVASAGAPWGIFHWSSEQRYHLENFREPWTRRANGPGSRRHLSYLSPAGEDMTRAEVVAPLTDQFVRF